MQKIAVLDHRITPDAQKEISALSSSEIGFPTEICAGDEIIARTDNAEIVLVSPWDNISKEYLDACPNIKYIGLCGTSTANIDLAELRSRHIAFSNIISHDKEGVAEFYFMQLVSLARGLSKWKWKPYPIELRGKHIGIIGLGSVGQAIAHMALAYKMRTSYYSPHRKSSWEDRGLEYLEKSQLLSESEILVICSPTNVLVLGEQDFLKIKPGSVLVQASGGTPFDKKAFFNWIQGSGNIAIFELSAGESNYHDYKDLPGVIFPPIVAGSTHEANERRGRRIIENLKSYLNSRQ